MSIATLTANTLLRRAQQHLPVVVTTTQQSVFKHAASQTTVWSTRSFAAAASSSDAAASYLTLKKQAKDRRRELYVAKQERKERLKTRRDGKPKNEKRNEFRKWFIKKKVDEEYMNRKARQAGLDWKMQVAVVLERENVVLPDKEDWETEYEELKAYLSQFGKVYPKELYNVDYEAEHLTTEQELMEQLPKGYVPAPRETEADKTGDVRTTERKLKTSVYLLVEQDGVWQMPTVQLGDDETLLDAGKRALSDIVGSSVEYWYLSNAPVAVDMVAFPAEDRKSGLYGTKTFFMKFSYDEGVVSKTELSADDFAWLDRGEVVGRVKEAQGDHVAKFYHYLL